MRKVYLFVALAGLVLSLAAFSGAAFAGEESDVTVMNHSDWALDHFFLSPVDQEKWGPDQLGEEIVAPGKSFVLHGIPCDDYDVKVVDEDGDECVVGGVDICGESQGWVFTSEALAACEAETEEP